MTAPSSSRTFVYVVSSDSGELFVLQLDVDGGALTLIETVSLLSPGSAAGACPLALSPDRHFLYAALRSEPFAITSFAIDRSTGKLTRIGEAALPQRMAYISTDHTGRYLLGASYAGNLISVSPIDELGLAASPSQVMETPPNAHCIQPDPSNRFVLNTSLGGDVLISNRFDVDRSELSPNTPTSVGVRAGAGPRHFCFHPNGRFVYLICELDASVYAFAYDGSSGSLREVQVVSALPDRFEGERRAAADLHLTPTGDLLYASVRGSSTIACFRVQSETGQLARSGVFPVTPTPRSFAIDSTGRYLIAVGESSNTLASYAIDASTGELKLLSEIPMGMGPNWVEIASLA